jgi:hypothetical protein
MSRTPWLRCVLDSASMALSVVYVLVKNSLSGRREASRCRMALLLNLCAFACSNVMRSGKRGIVGSCTAQPPAELFGFCHHHGKI